MILEYHRPKTLEEALALVARPNPPTVPLGGGTVLAQPGTPDLAVVDLQSLGLDGIEDKKDFLIIGAMVRLAQLMDYLGSADPLGNVIGYEASSNLRQVATVAGTLIAADGRSPLGCSLLALNVSARLAPEGTELSIGELLPLRGELLAGKILTEIILPKTARLAFESVARSPADRPIVAAAVARWPAGRTRVALAGFGAQPVLAFDGPEASGAEIAARDAYSHAEDAWASAEYRQQIAGILVARAVQSLTIT